MEGEVQPRAGEPYPWRASEGQKRTPLYGCHTTRGHNASKLHGQRAEPTKVYDTAEIRSQGLSLGYNVFADSISPPPRVAEDTFQAEPKWLVDPNTLKATVSSERDLSAEERARGNAAAARLLLFDPSFKFEVQNAAVQSTLRRLQDLDEEVAKMTIALVNALESDMAASQQRLDLQLTEAAARSAAHKVLADQAARDASALNASWRQAHSEGEAARKAALGRMAELAEDMQASIEEVQLRLTDHVLMGTREEAERLRRAPGPGGDELRALIRKQEKLAERQLQQKALLVDVARKALVALSEQDWREHTAEATIANSARLRALLDDAIGALKTSLASATNAPVSTPVRCEDNSHPNRDAAFVSNRSGQELVADRSSDDSGRSCANRVAAEPYGDGVAAGSESHAERSKERIASAQEASHGQERRRRCVLM